MVRFLILFTALLAGAGQAQDGEDGPICISVGQLWRGDNSETRSIETVPVPESYRLRFESTAPCVRYWLIEENLIDWHLDFGSAHSVSPALEYLTRGYLRDTPPPDRFTSEVERAWHAAQTDLRRAATVTQPENVNYSAQSRFTSASRSIQRLQTLVRARQDLIFIARQHLRAAETFDSLVFLDAAERHLRPAVESARFLAPLEQQPPARGILHLNLHAFRTDDLEMRASVLRARLDGTPDNLARAEAVLASKERPHYLQLGELAFSGGDDFCDIIDGAGERATLEATCQSDEDALQERVVSWLVARARLDLLVRPGAVRGWDGSPGTALRLLAQEELPDRGRCCGYRATDDVIRLRLATAESRHRMLLDRNVPDGYGEVSAWSDGLNELRQVERLIPAFEAPSRFRRVAEAWLRLWGEGPGLLSGDTYDPPLRFDHPEQLRYATYLRRTLASLDAIATGADSGLPPSRN